MAIEYSLFSTQKGTRRHIADSTARISHRPPHPQLLHQYHNTASAAQLLSSTHTATRELGVLLPLSDAAQQIISLPLSPLPLALTPPPFAVCRPHVE